MVSGSWAMQSQWKQATGELRVGLHVDLCVKIHFQMLRENEDWKRPPSWALLDAQWSLGYISTSPSPPCPRPDSPKIIVHVCFENGFKKKKLHRFAFPVTLFASFPFVCPGGGGPLFSAFQMPGFALEMLVNLRKKIIVSNKYLLFKNILRRLETIWANLFGTVFSFRDDKKSREKWQF